MKNSSVVALSLLIFGLLSLQPVTANAQSEEDPFAGFDDLFSELESFESESSEALDDSESEENSTDTSSEDLFGDDFFSDLDSFIESDASAEELLSSAPTQTAEETTTTAETTVEETNNFIHPRAYYQVVDIPEGKEHHVLYRTPGAILHRDEKTTLIRTDSSRYFSKYQWCDKAETEVVSNRLAALKISQGSPKGCREDMNYQFLPYKTFRTQR